MKKELTFNNQKFEKEVRETLRLEDDPISTTLAKNIDFLCLLDCELSDSDFDILYQFENLEELIIGEYHGTIDLSRLTPLEKLKYLTIHGNDYSGSDIINISALQQLKSLDHLFFEGFGSVDLIGLEQLHQLKELKFGWGIRIENVDLIGSLKNLTTLEFIDVIIPSLEFITHLNKDAEILLGDVIVDEPFDMRKLDSFKNCEYESLRVNGQYLTHYRQ